MMLLLVQQTEELTSEPNAATESEDKTRANVVEMDLYLYKIGDLLISLFLPLTLVMSVCLALFAIGFFMAVTHWWDRYAPTSCALSVIHRRTISGNITS